MGLNIARIRRGRGNIGLYLLSVRSYSLAKSVKNIDIFVVALGRGGM